MTEDLMHASAHFQLMVFADYHGIKKLYNLALSRLEDSLEKLDEKDTSARAALLLSFDEQCVPDHLIGAVMNLVIWDAIPLWENKVFRSSLEQSRGLKSEFLDAVMARITQPEHRQCSRFYNPPSPASPFGMTPDTAIIRNVRKYRTFS